VRPRKQHFCRIHQSSSRGNTPHFAALVVCAVFAIAFGVGDAGAAPITFNTALPVAEGEFVFRSQAVVDQSGDDPSGADRDRTAWAVVSVLGYGATSDLALFAILPYVDKRLDSTVAGERRSRGASGIGDLSIFGRYTVFRKDRPGGTFRIAPFLGVETPTGDDDEQDVFGRLPPSVQPGSGSFDPFAGLVATYQTLQFQIDAQVSYKANMQANDFEFGDVARLDGSIQYRFWPRRLGKGVPDFLYGVLEANLIHQDESRVGGTKNPNSGGTTLFIAPGLQYVSKRWILEGSVQIPALQNLNGVALEKDYIVRGGFRLNF
jgi:hypothetical protein